MKFWDFKVISATTAKHHKKAFWLLLAVGILLMCVWGAAKSPVTFHIDEIWQYSYANSNGKHRWVVEENDMGKWLPASIFREYITVQPGERFSFAAILKASRYDIHPPLTHFMINSVCSLFPDQFSKWYGLVLNIATYAFTIWALYALASNLFGSRPKALAATSLWAFSMGAVDTVVYIRMYCMLTLLAVAAVYFSVRYLKEGDGKFLFLTFASFVVGGLTDYIFWIFGFFLTVAFVLVHLFRNFRMAVDYAAVTFASFVTACLIFPTTVMQVFDKESPTPKATEAFNVIDKLRLFFHPDYVIQRLLTYSAEQSFLLPPAAVTGIISFLGFLIIAAVLLILLISVISAGLPGLWDAAKAPSRQHPLAVNDMVLAKLSTILPDAVVVFWENIRRVLRFMRSWIRANPAPMFIAIAVFLCSYTLAAIFPDFQIWTVRGFFYMFPFFSLLVAAMLFLLHDKLKVPAGLLALVICLLLVRGYIVSTSPFLYRDGYDKLEKKLEGKNVIIAMDAPSSVLRVPNFSPALMDAKGVYIMAVSNESYRQKMAIAIKSMPTNSECMIINLHGAPPENNFARWALGPEFLLTADTALVSELAANGYTIEVENKIRHVFQWFNLYKVSTLGNP